MELPDDVLAQIKDFSRPITRPDWRHLRPMPELKFLKAVAHTYNILKLPIIDSFVERYDRNHMKYLFSRYAYNQPYIADVRIRY